MKGNLYTFEKNYGFAIGEDDKRYMVHVDDVITENRTIGCVKRILESAKPSKPIAITFEPGQTPKNAYHYPDATEIRISTTK